MQIRETRQGRKLTKGTRRCKDVHETKHRQFKNDILKSPQSQKNFKNCIGPLGWVGQKHNRKAQDFRKSVIFFSVTFTQPGTNTFQTSSE